MNLEFLIAASATPSFFSQIAFFRLSLNSLGGIYRDARVVAVFGDHTSETISPEWRQHFDGIEVVWAHQIGAENPDHKAQHDRRFEIIHDDTDLAIICDADVAMLRPFDSFAIKLVREKALGGVIAHGHFPWGDRARDPDAHWPELVRAVLDRPDIPRPYKYTLMPPETPPSVPFYINYGVLAGPPELMLAFFKRDVVIRETVAELVGQYWAPQVSLPLTCADLELPTITLPMRYNFPNDPRADALYPGELDQVIFMHYLRLRHFKRHEIFSDPDAFARLINGAFDGSNEVFRKHVEKVTGGSFPFHQ